MGVYRHIPPPHIGGAQPLEARKLPPSITAVPENDPPFGLKTSLGAILKAWEPGPPLVKISKYFPQAEISALDDPPFGLKTNLYPILKSWERDLFPASIVRFLLQVEPDNPPFGVYRNAEWKILQQWQVPNPPLQILRPFPFAVPVNDPPFGLRMNLYPILAAWLPSPPTPRILKYFPREEIAAQDDPPFGLKSNLQLVLQAWQLASPTSRRLSHLPQEQITTIRRALLSRHLANLRLRGFR